MEEEKWKTESRWKDIECKRERDEKEGEKETVQRKVRIKSQRKVRKRKSKT